MIRTTQQNNRNHTRNLGLACIQKIVALITNQCDPWSTGNQKVIARAAPNRGTHTRRNQNVVAFISVDISATTATMDDGVVPRAAMQFDRYEHAIANHNLIIPLITVSHNSGHARVEKLTATKDNPHRFTAGITANMFDNVVLVCDPFSNATDAVAVAHVEVEFTRAAIVYTIGPKSVIARRVTCQVNRLGQLNVSQGEAH